ncbi:phosphatase PAP2-related protein [Mucilaginibacter sp. 14171R-50]|uniref:phosphatase PAP2-related protein n=1 Tax=Mucilaginibacter sp. 14171R-50 TaxID=2703789 RepID=UPI00192EDF88|nr:phosphatase PAP2-related protein [Mucilaginibacter sp. 14171R-50]
MTELGTPSIKQAWTAALQSPKKRDKLLIGSFIVAIILSSLPLFFSFIQKRKGTVLNDWVLAHVPAYDVSVVIFTIIWGMALLILIRALYNPVIYINYVWTLIFINIARMLTIYLVALDPPKGLIHLVDPLTGVFYGNNVITRDLFFSGHTSTLVLIFLCLEKRTDKILGFISIVAVMALLLVQHIHYTIDVVAAPVIVYMIFVLTRRLLKLDKLKNHED